MAQIKVIYGAPCAGKTTYVSENKGANDLVFDFDSVRSAIEFSEIHSEPTSAGIEMTMKLREAFADNAAGSSAETAWIICTRKDQIDLDAEYIEISATKEECYEHLKNDDSRPDKEAWKALIDRYFDEKRFKTMDRIERTFTQKLTFRTDEATGIIEGVPVVFNSETVIGGSFRERILPEAIREETLKDVRLLVNHNFSELPLARSRNNNENSTMRLWIEPDGIHMRARLDIENNARARELYSAVERRDVDGMSFAFEVDGEEWTELDEALPLRSITAIRKIYEFSVVMNPAYEATTVNARALDSELASMNSAKEAQECAKRAEREALENAKKVEELRTEVIRRGENLCKKD